MYIARILYPVEVLGCGKRIGIWFNGCPHHCKGCSNPELWDTDERYSVSLKNVMALVRKISADDTVDGFTITGGEPFYQPEALNMLTAELSGISDDILVYSGYTITELKEMKLTDVDNVLDRIAVLIDGRYVHEKNNNCAMRGSDNQQVHILNKKYADAYNEYMKSENKIQNFMLGNSVVSVGIHKRGFKFE